MNRPNSLNEARPSFAQHDALLALMLGALSYSKLIDNALRQSSQNGEPLERDHPLVIAALGVVSLRRTLERWLEEAAGAPERAEEHSPNQIQGFSSVTDSANNLREIFR